LAISPDDQPDFRIVGRLIDLPDDESKIVPRDCFRRVDTHQNVSSLDAGFAGRSVTLYRLDKDAASKWRFLFVGTDNLSEPDSVLFFPSLTFGVLEVLIGFRDGSGFSDESVLTSSSVLD